MGKKTANVIYNKDGSISIRPVGTTPKWKDGGPGSMSRLTHKDVTGGGKYSAD